MAKKDEEVKDEVKKDEIGQVPGCDEKGMPLGLPDNELDYMYL